MKRRNRVLLMWMLTGIWLCVQSPWAHSQRIQAQAQAQTLALAADAAPCHDAKHHKAPVDVAGCCADGHCDDHCAQFSWALAATTPQLIVRGAMRLIPIHVAGLQSLRQPELFRPPI